MENGFNLSSDNNNSKSSLVSAEQLLVLEQAKKLKTTFLDNMSHELRTPVTVILGYAGILYDEINDPDLKEMAEIILKSSNRLTEALNLLLDQSDVESERLKVDLGQEDLFRLLNETERIYKTVVEDKNLELVFSSSIQKAECLLDKKMFNKIMSNLLNNAIKFTEKGKISLSLDEEIINSEKKYSVIVSDTGIGISEEKQSVIFEAFRQVSEGMNRLYQGTGLGLSVSKKFLELMNGEISCSSKLGEGSSFKLILPAIKSVP